MAESPTHHKVLVRVANRYNHDEAYNIADDVIAAIGTLSLEHLANLLNEAGYDAQKVRLHGPARLMVAAKEPS